MNSYNFKESSLFLHNVIIKLIIADVFIVVVRRSHWKLFDHLYNVLKFKCDRKLGPFYTGLSKRMHNIRNRKKCATHYEIEIYLQHFYSTFTWVVCCTWNCLFTVRVLLLLLMLLLLQLLLLFLCCLLLFKCSKNTHALISITC